MISYLALGGGANSWGVSTRAAALCRALMTVDSDVTVYTHGSTVPLEHFGIPHETLRSGQARHHRWPGLVIADGPYRPDVHADVWVWRRGRLRVPHPNVLRVEPDDTGAEYYWPILALRDDEILSRNQARAELGWTGQKPRRVLVPSNSGDLPTTKHNATLSGFPVLRLLRAADHVIGAAGAALWAEVHHLGLPATWYAVHGEQQRRIDTPSHLWVPQPDATSRAVNYLRSL
jgi:hypothetical protein